MKWLLGLLGLLFIFGRSNSSASSTHSGGDYDDQSWSNHFCDDFEDDDNCNNIFNNDCSSSFWDINSGDSFESDDY